MAGSACEALRVPLISIARPPTAVLAHAIVFRPVNKINFLGSFIAIYLCDRYPSVASSRRDICYSRVLELQAVINALE